jgi:hypothetical protein
MGERNVEVLEGVFALAYDELRSRSASSAPDNAAPSSQHIRRVAGGGQSELAQVRVKDSVMPV